MKTVVTRIHAIDSHTGGEPTRVVVSGGPPLGNSSLTERLQRFRSHHDRFRSAIVNEPRGSDAIVGALLCEPVDRSCSAGVIFFNNVGYLGMCGHGTIGLGVTLAHLGRITPGTHLIETPVGVVSMELHQTGEVSFENVASYRLAKGVVVDVQGVGPVTGDVAWGGNWFFLTRDSPCELHPRNLDRLTSYAWSIRRALKADKIAGAHGQEIDHIEVFSDPGELEADSRNFVLCPGGSYDRSPCGTGTSAKLACLYTDDKIREGQIWRQAGILGSIFEGSITIRDRALFPRIKGSAFVTSEAHLIIHDKDPFGWGIATAPSHLTNWST
ncbi:MAG: proline racemase family protein [Bryobacteraceae bacterium]